MGFSDAGALWVTAWARHKHIVLEGLPALGLPYLVARDVPQGPVLLICGDEEQAERRCRDLQALGVADAAYFPGDEHVPFEDISPDPNAVFQRFALRERALRGALPGVIVTTAAAIQGRWFDDATFQNACRTLLPGITVDREALAAHLVLLGYQPVSVVEDEGTFALRGGVVDIFVPGLLRPVRLDLFGDELDSIKGFDPETQRTFAAHDELRLFPIREVLFTAETRACAVAWLRILQDVSNIPTRRLRTMGEEIQAGHYFYGIEALWPIFYGASSAIVDTLLSAERRVILDDPTAVQATWEMRWNRAELERRRAFEHHQPAVERTDHLLDPQSLADKLRAVPRAAAVTLALPDEGTAVEHALGDMGALAKEMAARRQDPSHGEILDPLVQLLSQAEGTSREVFLCCQSRGMAERLRELLLARRIDLPVRDLPKIATIAENRRPRRAICVAALSQSLEDRAHGAVLISDVDILAAAPRTLRRRKRASAEGLSTLRDLHEGEPVIHQDHGIGRYLGLKRLVLNGVDGDYVHLEYADGDKLYLPVYRLNLLQAYRGPAGVKLDKLGGTRWERAKARVRDAVLAIAHELLALQAQRQALPGFRLPPPEAHFRAFEATFPFEETPDQQRAIDEVLGDLQKDAPMDRLVCGDVGFGKTEVAMRAAYLAVLGGRQVAVLVPTTVLAEQHRNTFADRLAPHGVTVEVVSRFRTAKEVASIRRRLQEGAIDILIGTHRLLSPDIAFKDLGLLVVDEEQRFGVKHKERLKQLRTQVHVLTLSATPIPRTLHMATTGMRDLSLIQTPPAERSAIRTEVLRFDEEVVTEAIRRELHRGGQVFVVHNRVHSIDAMANLMRRLVPEAHVAMAHGQMSGDELERIMVDFVRREHNVLVCTAIIESGIDIPSANTMIVNRADTFGLSQLYQLRGRIGRGRERAYAYLMLPRSDTLSHEAQERLAVLKRFSELGAGFQIATHDLELRGAGDLLGADQSGSIAAVGFELYTELLAEAVSRVKGQTAQEDIEPDIKLPVPAVLPETYVPEPMQRLAFYQRMAQARSDAAVFDVCAEIKDIYGPAPPEVDALAEVMVIRRRLKAVGAVALSGSADNEAVKIGLSFAPTAPIDRNELVRLCQAESRTYRLLPSGRLALTLPPVPSEDTGAFLRLVRQAIGTLKIHGG